MILLALILLNVAMCTQVMVVPFVDLWSEVKDPQCLVAKYPRIALRIYQSIGRIDPLFVKNAWKLRDASHLESITGYINPCLKCDLRKQVEKINDKANEVGADSHLTIVVSGSQWNLNCTAHKEFLKAYIATLAKYGISVSIQTSAAEWARIMGPETEDFKEYPLWYVYHDNTCPKFLLDWGC
eukprot:TRINITY_DN986_c0_g1_i3.p1 TRINITY_DN986_c0_g1~~TRINITY_DN986_c0_g1_i3.p1  ORF type:complete len:183 (-),score=14.93 TRINITY_DN986_c0_g1_i3:200-748(-)